MSKFFPLGTKIIEVWHTTVKVITSLSLSSLFFPLSPSLSLSLSLSFVLSLSLSHSLSVYLRSLYEMISISYQALTILSNT
jgi:hypothetical protein